MSKKQSEEKWVVEVRRAHAVEHRPGNWCCVAQCDDERVETHISGVRNLTRGGA